MNKGLSEKLKDFFPDILPAPRPLVKDQEIKDPNWVAGRDLAIFFLLALLSTK
jgi:hypothetical protein